MMHWTSSSIYPYQRLYEEDAKVDDQGKTDKHVNTSRERKWKTIALSLFLVLVASLGTNTALLFERFCQPWKLRYRLPTQVGLIRNVDVTITDKSDYSDLNMTIQNAAWNRHEVDSYNLYVALDDKYSSALGLPRSQRWPWDDTKGVYLLGAAHEIHCAGVIRSVLNDQHYGVPEYRRLWQYPHAIHCLDMIRMSIMCNADDNLLYTGRLNANVHVKEPIVGNGMTKQCRDWDTLMDWAAQHSACYAYVEPGNDDFPEVDRYKYCPDGTEPWKETRF